MCGFILRIGDQAQDSHQRDKKMAELATGCKGGAFTKWYKGEVV